MTKTQIVVNPKNSNCDKNESVTKLEKIILLQNSKTQIVTILKKKKLNWGQNSNTKTVIKLKNSNCDKTQKLKL